MRSGTTSPPRSSTHSDSGFAPGGSGWRRLRARWQTRREGKQPAGDDMHRDNLAARAGRWSAAHWKTATLGWIAFVAVVAIGQATGTVKLTDSESATGEAARAQAILQGAGFSQPAAENVLVQSTTLTVADPAFRATVERVAAKLRTLPQVQDVRSPLSLAAAKTVSKDGRSALVQFASAGTRTPPTSGSSRCSTRGAGRSAHPGFTRRGDRRRERQPRSNDVVDQDFKRAEATSVPMTFADPAVRIRRIRRRRSSRCCSPSPRCSARSGSARSSATSSTRRTRRRRVILLMGMAVGVDYSLFYLQREREERVARPRAARRAPRAPPRPRGGPCSSRASPC